MGVAVFAVRILAEAAKVHPAEQDEHEADGELHGEADARRDDQSEDDDAYADSEDGDGVACSPERADPGGTADATFAADDGGDCDDVVGIRCMPHAQNEAQNENRKQIDRCGGRCKSGRDDHVCELLRRLSLVLTDGADASLLYKAPACIPANALNGCECGAATEINCIRKAHFSRPLESSSKLTTIRVYP